MSVSWCSMLWNKISFDVSPISAWVWHHEDMLEGAHQIQVIISYVTCSLSELTSGKQSSLKHKSHQIYPQSKTFRMLSLPPEVKCILWDFMRVSLVTCQPGLVWSSNPMSELHLIPEPAMLFALHRPLPLQRSGGLLSYVHLAHSFMMSLGVYDGMNPTEWCHGICKQEVAALHRHLNSPKWSYAYQKADSYLYHYPTRKICYGFQVKNWEVSVVWFTILRFWPVMCQVFC